MGSKFDSHWRNIRFDTLKRRDVFDTFGMPPRPAYIAASGGSLRRTGQFSADGILLYDGTSWRTTGQKWDGGFGIDVFNNTVWYSTEGYVSGSYGCYVCKYKDGVQTVLCSISGYAPTYVTRFIPYGTGFIMVGLFEGLTPIGGSYMTAHMAAYYDGTSWHALSLPSGIVDAHDACIHEEAPWVATSHGAFRWNGSSWEEYNNGLFAWPLREGYCITSWNGSLYMAGLLAPASDRYGECRVSRWTGSTWVTLGWGTSSYPKGFASTPTVLVVTTSTKDVIREWDGSSWSSISGSDAYYYVAQKEWNEEFYWACTYTSPRIPKIRDRVAGTWTDIAGATYASRLAVGFFKV